MSERPPTVFGPMSGGIDPGDGRPPMIVLGGGSGFHIGRVPAHDGLSNSDIVMYGPGDEWMILPQRGIESHADVLKFVLECGGSDEPQALQATREHIRQLENHESDIRAVLREACKEYGDNDWPDDLHLGDVIEKHLMRPMLYRLAQTEVLGAMVHEAAPEMLYQGRWTINKIRAAEGLGPLPAGGKR